MGPGRTYKTTRYLVPSSLEEVGVDDDDDADADAAADEETTATAEGTVEDEATGVAATDEEAGAEALVSTASAELEAADVVYTTGATEVLAGV